jgi:hypothetical protein
VAQARALSSSAGIRALRSLDGRSRLIRPIPTHTVAAFNTRISVSQKRWQAQLCPHSADRCSIHPPPHPQQQDTDEALTEYKQMIQIATSCSHFAIAHLSPGPR